MPDLKQEKETFSGGFAVFFATLGSAVGLGNVWKFPYVTGQNGGAAFLLIYLGCVLLVGVPILIAEYVMGRHTRRFDYLSSNILLPLGGIFTALLVGWVIKPQIVINELTNQGKLSWGRLISSYFFILRYVAPILVIIVFLRSLDLI